MSSWINTAPLAAVTRLRLQERKKKNQFVTTFRFRVKCNRTNKLLLPVRKLFAYGKFPVTNNKIQHNSTAAIPTVHWIGWQSTEVHLQWDYLRLPIPSTFRRDHASYGPSLPTTSSKGIELFISVSPKAVSDVIILDDITHSLLDWTKHLRFSLTIILFRITVKSIPL